MFIRNGVPISLDVEHTFGDTRIPAGWFYSQSVEVRESYGITEQADPAQPEPPAKTPQQINAEVWAQVKAFEMNEQCPRLLRDLAEKEAKAAAAAIGMTLEQVYEAALLPNPQPAALQWKKFKDFQNAIGDIKKKLVPE